MKKLITAALLIGVITGILSSYLIESGMDIYKYKRLENKFNELYPDFEITNVSKSQIKGVYEVEGIEDLLYSDGRYLFLGHILSFDGENNFTQEKLKIMQESKIERILASMVSPLIIKEGTGEQKVIVVTNPECIYCSKTESWFNDTNTSRHILFMPTQRSKEIPIHILCSEHPEDEYKKIMKLSESYFSGVKNLSFSSFLQSSGITLNKCTKGKQLQEKMNELISKTGATGTPMFIVDNQMILGADPVLKQVLK